MPERVGVSGANYKIGELAVDVDSLATKSEILSAHDMPDMADLWGWGFYRKTAGSRVDIGYASAAGSLQKAGLKAEDIDTLVLCCGDALNYYQQNQISGELAHRLRLGYLSMHWIGGAGCASFFAAIGVAHSLVLSGTAARVLIVSMDKIEDDRHRFQRYGVLSDGACSLIVTRSARADFTIMGSKVLSCPSALSNGGQDFQEKCQLITEVFDVFREFSLSTLAASSVYLGSNVFMPIQELELSVMPLDEIMTFEANTARYGHCYSADPIINLVDFYSDTTHKNVKNAVLASTAHGHFGLMLLQKNVA